MHDANGSTVVWNMNGTQLTGAGVVGDIPSPWIIQHG